MRDCYAQPQPPEWVYFWGCAGVLLRNGEEQTSDTLGHKHGSAYLLTDGIRIGTGGNKLVISSLLLHSHVMLMLKEFDSAEKDQSLLAVRKRERIERIHRESLGGGLDSWVDQFSHKDNTLTSQIAKSPCVWWATSTGCPQCQCHICHGDMTIFWIFLQRKWWHEIIGSPPRPRSPWG